VSALGGAVLLVTGVGVAAAEHMIPTGHHDTASPGAGAPDDGGRTATAASTTTSRSADRETGSVSRSGSRPRLPAQPTRRAAPKATTTTSSTTHAAATDRQSTAAATRAATLRAKSLQTADTSAQQYAKDLKSDAWVLPTSGFHISVWFGESGPYWSSGYHTGIDFATAYGTPVVAVQDATVFQTGWDGPYGNQIRLQFSNGDQVWYNHLSAIEVSKGDQVRKGEELGRVGETGNAFGYHLHFEYRLAKDLSTAVDPRPFFAAHGITLH
jgi:murein DD-endopeptidase MepM/ murein hydrolase activator NlpD